MGKKKTPSATTAPNAPTSVKNIDRESENKYTIQWKIPASGSDSKSKKRWLSIGYKWVIDETKVSKKTKKKRRVLALTKKGGKTVGAKGTLAKNDTDVSLSLKRDEYYPVTKQKINELTAIITPKNKKQGKSASRGYKFELPKKPKVTFEFDETNFELSINLEFPDEGKYERYNTTYAVNRKNVGFDVDGYTKGMWKQLTKATVESDSKSLGPYGIGSSYLSSGTQIVFSVSSTTRGLKGDTVVSADDGPKYVIAPPESVTIDNIVVMQPSNVLFTRTAVGSLPTNGHVIVSYKKKEKVVEGEASADTAFELERLVTQAGIKTPAQAAVLSGWNKVDDNSSPTKDRARSWQGACMGEDVVDVLTAMGASTGTARIFDTRVWYRVKTIRQGMVTYSDPYEATDFYCPAPSAANDYAAFVDIENGGDGKTIDVVVGWDNPNVPDEGVDVYPEATWTTEVSWSEYADGWRSNKTPTAKEIDWVDSASEHSARLDTNGYFKDDINQQNDRVKWAKSAPLSIKDLTTGTPYYLMTRRHMVYDDISSFGPYTPAPDGYWPFIPYDNPSKVSVNTPEALVYGEDMRVSWFHNANAKQKSYAVYLVEVPTVASSVNNPLAKTLVKKALVAGTGETDAVTLSWDEVLAPLIPSASFANGNETAVIDTSVQLGIGVGVSTGGMEVLSYSDSEGKYSELNIVPIATVPECGACMDSTLTAQQGSKFYVFANGPQVEIHCDILAYGMSISMPDRNIEQAEDDYVWTESFSSNVLSAVSELTEAELENEDIASLATSFSHYAALDIPSSRELYDGGSYKLVVKGVSEVSSSLVSGEVEVDFTVNYSHQAHPPGERSRVETRMSDGTSPYCEVYLQKPDNYQDGDLCNVYRISRDGAVLIAPEVGFERTIVDRFPPFSYNDVMHYAIQTITSDGDMAVREVGYSLKREGLRIDWGEDQFVELPFDVELDDSWTKDAEIRTHMDGSKSAVSNLGVEHDKDLKSKLVRLESPEQFKRLSQLAQYPGTALVRAHDGSCLEGVVNVTGLTNSYEDLTAPVTIRVKEVDLTDGFKPTEEDIRKVVEN